MAEIDRQLTEKEQKVINEFEKVCPSLGAMAKANILNNHLTGWAEIIAEMSDEEILISSGFSSNSFSYQHIGH